MMCAAVGWMPGDYGKYAVNGSYSVGLMLLTVLLAPEVLNHPVDPPAGDAEDCQDWLDVADAQLRWQLKMQREDGAVNHKVASHDWPNMDVKPDDDDAIKWLMPVTSTATADFAAIMSLVSFAYDDQDEAMSAATFQEAAKRTLAWLGANPELAMIETHMVTGSPRRLDGFNGLVIGAERVKGQGDHHEPFRLTLNPVFNQRLRIHR